MGSYTQEGRLFRVDTPLGPDVLLFAGLSGEEGISRLFRFELELLADRMDSSKVVFEELLGQSITIHVVLPNGLERHLNGICRRFSEGEEDEHFRTYRMEVVPKAWLLTRRRNSRIFQQMTVPEILKEVLKGIQSRFELLGRFEPRDYCVQYRESDFDFAARLMEDEGIFYFFEHGKSRHTMVLANDRASHPEVEPGPSTLIYEQLKGGTREEDRIYLWEKAQEIRAEKVLLWDHCLELPHQHLESPDLIVPSVTAGRVSHELKLPLPVELEQFDYPGTYAGRFDGIDPGGGERPEELGKIRPDGTRTARIRMEEETTPALTIRAASHFRHVASGYKFSLTRHWDANGDYVVTSVVHHAKDSDYRAKGLAPTYRNELTCIPYDLPFRPPRRTPRPRVEGTQTAVVVGPPGEEIFTDKYGRVKVQFHWDREGKHDNRSSCWIRVATPWAGRQWGMLHLPRIGQEVVVDFLEGDPDQPLIVGSVYNAQEMPPWGLPEHRTRSGVKSRSTLKGTPDDFNELRFEDEKGKEHVYLHAQRDLLVAAERDHSAAVGRDEDVVIGRDQFVTVKGKIQQKVGGDVHVQTGGSYVASISGDLCFSYGGDRDESVKTKFAVEAGQEIHLKAPKVVIEATSAAELIGPGGFVRIDGGGVIIEGGVVKINCGGSADGGSGTKRKPAKDPEKPEKPGGTEAPFTQISDDAPPQDVCVTPEQAEYNASHYSSIK